MRALQVLLCVLVVLVLIGQIRVGCKAVYDQSGPAVYIRLAAFHIKVFPLPKKEKPEKPKKDKPPKEKKQKEPVPLQEKLGGALGYAQALLPVVLEALGYFRQKLSVDTLHMRLVAGGGDPADAAMLYGRANAVLGALWYPLVEAVHVKDGYARAELDFDAPQTTFHCTAALSLKIGQVVWFAVYFGIRALRGFLSERSRQRNEKTQRKAV